MPSTGVRRTADGLQVRLEQAELDVLRSLPGTLTQVLRGEIRHDVTARLFPRASDDDDVDAAYRELVGDDLVASRVAAVERFAATLDDGRFERRVWVVDLDADDAHAWLSVVNDLRLVLAPLAGIDDEEAWTDGPDPRSPESLLLYHLSWLQEQLLAALVAGLPDGDGDD